MEKTFLHKLVKGPLASEAQWSTRLRGSHLLPVQTEIYLRASSLSRERTAHASKEQVQMHTSAPPRAGPHL